MLNDGEQLFLGINKGCLPNIAMRSQIHYCVSSNTQRLSSNRRYVFEDAQ